MVALHEQWPEYDFARHKGYLTPEHSAALHEHGPCPEHRFSYVNVRSAQRAAIFRQNGPMQTQVVPA